MVTHDLPDHLPEIAPPVLATERKPVDVRCHCCGEPFNRCRETYRGTSEQPMDVLAVPRELLEGIIGDYRVCLGVSQAAYEEFCRKGGGKKPNEAWGLHCRRRIDELAAALARVGGAK